MKKLTTGSIITLEYEQVMKEYKKNLENDGVVLSEPSPTPDAPWLDDAIDRVDPKKFES